MIKFTHIFVAAMLFFQSTSAFSSDNSIVAEEQKKELTGSLTETVSSPIYPVNNADGTVSFVGQSWDVIKDYGNGTKMIAMQNSIADSQFNTEFYFNTNDDTSNGYQDSDIKLIVDGWYDENISGTEYEQFVQPVKLSNPTLGPIKQTYGWSSNDDTTGSIGYTPWVRTILAPDNYPTIVGEGHKQAFLMSGSDVTKDNQGNLSDSSIKHIEKMAENGIEISWLSTVGGYSNFASNLRTGFSEVRNNRVFEVYSVVPTLVVESYNQAAPVIVKFQDKDGNSLADDVVLTGPVGTRYEATAANIEGWSIKETPTNATGTFTENSQEVVYVYEQKVVLGSVSVKYQDKDGNSLADDVILTGPVGTTYESTVANIEGWNLIETPTNATGTFTENSQEVVYVYEQKVVLGSVSVKYHDKDGNSLADDVILTGPVGTTYESTATTIEGWILKETPTNATGIFTENSQEVVYVYNVDEATDVGILPTTGIGQNYLGGLLVVVGLTVSVFALLKKNSEAVK